MSRNPPPLPRKPASYSPTFLERQNLQYFDQHVYADPQIEHGAYAARDLERDWSEYGGYDQSREPVLRPLQRRENEMYGRPLPMPPGAQLAMPEIDGYRDYEDILHSYNSLGSSPTRDQALNLPQSRSTTSINARGGRPLPQAPDEGMEPDWSHYDRLDTNELSGALYGVNPVYRAASYELEPVDSNRQIEGTRTQYTSLGKPVPLDTSAHSPPSSYRHGRIYGSQTGLFLRNDLGSDQHGGSREYTTDYGAHTLEFEPVVKQNGSPETRYEMNRYSSRSSSEINELKVQSRASRGEEGIQRWHDAEHNLRYAVDGDVRHDEQYPVPHRSAHEGHDPTQEGRQILEMPLLQRISTQDSNDFFNESAWPLAVPPVPPLLYKQPYDLYESPSTNRQVSPNLFRVRTESLYAPVYHETVQPQSVSVESAGVDAQHDFEDARKSLHYDDDANTPQISRHIPSTGISSPFLQKNPDLASGHVVESLASRTSPLSPVASTLPLSPQQKKRISRSHTASALTYTSSTRKPIPHSLTSTSLEFSSLLPTIPRGLKKISSSDYETCGQVWSRTCLFYWIRNIGINTDSDFVELVTGLFTHTVPTLSDNFVRKIATDLLVSYMSAGEITKSPTGNYFLTFGDSVADGILPHFSNAGCYSTRCHTNLTTNRCYSSRCSRTIRSKHTYKSREQLSKEESEDWAKYWNLSKDEEPLRSLDSREIQRQYQIHEVVYSETDYLADLKILRDVFLQSLLDLGQTDQDFTRLVFGQLHRLIELSEKSLGPALQDRQSTQGPLVSNIGDVFLTWIKLARTTYVQFAAEMRYADRSLRTQRAHNPKIREWLLRCEADPRTKKLDFFSYHGSPTRRMQRYALLIGDVLRRSPEDSFDREPLERAIAEIKAVCQECDARVKISEDKIYLMDLSSRLMWKSTKKDLSLTDPSREIKHKGDLQRKSESYTSWQMREVILLDNYLFCVKQVKDGPQKVTSREPIPIDYLIIDDFDGIVYKSSSTKLLGGTITHTVASSDASLKKPTIEARSMTISSVDNNSGNRGGAGEVLYPFTVRHAGKPDEKLTFYAESDLSRSGWISAILMAKASRWEKISAREPLEVQILADQAFAAFPSQPVQIRPEIGPVNAIEAASMSSSKARLKHISVARIQCSSMFRGGNGAELFLVGTDDGVYANNGNTGSWYRLISILKVTQIAVLEEFGTLLVLADKVLIAYMLQDLFNSDTIDNVSRKPGQKLSGNKDVNFFEVGVLKGRLLVIYKKRENGNSVFKVLEPVIGKKQEKKSFFKKGVGASADSFRDFDVRDPKNRSSLIQG